MHISHPKTKRQFTVGSPKQVQFDKKIDEKVGNKKRSEKRAGSIFKMGHDPTWQQVILTELRCVFIPPPHQVIILETHLPQDDPRMSVYCSPLHRIPYTSGWALH